MFLQRDAGVLDVVKKIRRRHHFLCDVMREEQNIARTQLRQIVVTEHRGGFFGLISKTQRKIHFDDASQRLGHMRGRLIFVDHTLEAADRGLIKVLLLMVSQYISLKNRLTSSLKYQIPIKTVIMLSFLVK